MSPVTLSQESHSHILMMGDPTEVDILHPKKFQLQTVYPKKYLPFSILKNSLIEFLHWQFLLLKYFWKANEK